MADNQIDLKAVIKDAVQEGATQIASSPMNNMAPKDAKEVVAATLESAAPKIEALQKSLDVLTNQEPNVRSIQFWVALFGIVAPILALFGVVFPAELQAQAALVIVGVISLASSVALVYNRFFRKYFKAEIK